MKIIIFGGNGFLGKRLKTYLIKKNFIVQTAGKSPNNDIQLDVTESNLIKLLKPYNFQIAINLIAITDIAFCEKNSKECFSVNVLGAKRIAEYCSEYNIYAINISTDMVYNSFRFSSENEEKPINKYGFSKLNAEKEFMKIKSASLRLAFLGKSVDREKGFVDWLINSNSSPEKINLWDNIYSTPISIKDTLEVINITLKRKLNGIFNVGCSEEFTKYNFGCNLLKKLDLSLLNIKKEEYINTSNNIKRPLGMSMNSCKFINYTGWKQPDLSTTIKNVANDYLNEN